MSPENTLLVASARLTVVVGPGGVGKTTLTAAMGAAAAENGEPTLVMTFDPSRRLREALGLDAADLDRELPVPGATDLFVALLDARRTFDRVVARHAPDEAARRRILQNRFYAGLAGSLAGVLEYMAMERLLEVAESGRYRRVVLDTPPARNALDFLDAPRRIVEFLDSGALRFALKPWFDDGGRLRPATRLGPLGRGLESVLDRVVGMELLRDMAEFFQAFAPLYAGFRERAQRVQALLTSPETSFVLVTTPEPERVADTMFFARALVERGHALRAVVANRVTPGDTQPALRSPLCRSLEWIVQREAEGLAALRDLLGEDLPLLTAPLEAEPPIGLPALLEFARAITPETPSPR